MRDGMSRHGFAVAVFATLLGCAGSSGASSAGAIGTSGGASSVTTASSASSTGAAASASTSGSAGTTTASASTSGPTSSSSSGGLVGRSISQWTVCDGQTDDSLGAAKAFAAAANDAFTLIVDCPVFIHVGTDIARQIYLEDGTTVAFEGKGLFIVDDTLVPTFVLINASNLTFTNWQVEYVGSEPIDDKTGGHYFDGGYVVGEAPANAFNDLALTPWLAKNRQITFTGGASAPWLGPTNNSAIFYIAGSVTNLTVDGMKLFVPPQAGGSQFIPMCFSMGAGYKSHQTIAAGTPYNSTYYAIPTGLTFSNIDLDGTYMGWQGGGQDLTFSNITSHRYGDLQDADGGLVGGVGKWFAPPHLFYLNYNSNGDAPLQNDNIHISNVTDEGDRVGVARDDGGNGGSGYADSLKIAAHNSTVDTYTSYRPDGLMDVLFSDNLKISNVTATFDSAFLNNLYPGIRWPGPAVAGPYTDVTLQNVSITDAATRSVQPPLGGANAANNSAITLSGVSVTLNQWAGNGNLMQDFGGTGDDVLVDYTLTGSDAHLQAGQKGSLTWQLQAGPVTLTAGSSTTLTWLSSNASSCAASGAWSGTLGTSGTKSVAVSAAGDAGFTLTCTGAGETGSSTVFVDAHP